jgi:CRP/FNR family transcriptional regulator, cyclic AMP receptor protein
MQTMTAVGELTSQSREDLLAILGRAGKRITFKPGEHLCTQGDDCGGIHYIVEGMVKLTTISRHGRAAILAFLWPGDFFGESCLAGRARRRFTAEALTRTSAIFIKARAMKRLLQEETAVAAHFLKHLIERNRRIEDDLLGHIFESSEERLARALVRLWRHGKSGKSPSLLEKMDQDTLAAVVGTTRPRVNQFMNKFRKMGWIKYAGGPGIVVNPSLENFLSKHSAEAG